MTHRDDDPDRCTPGERCRGILELTIIVGMIACVFLFPSLLLLPVLAVAGGMLAALAVWDDAACRAADKISVTRRRHNQRGA